MRVRALSAAAVVVLAVAGLSACTSRIGQAASVDSSTLSDTDLGNYLKPGATTYTDPNSKTSVVPKLYALESWVDDQLFERAVVAKGGSISTAELNEVSGLVLGTGQVSDVATFYGKLGYASTFAALFLHEQEMVVLLAKRLLPSVSDDQVIQQLQAGSLGQQLLAAVQSVHADVRVSGRYGTWNPAQLTIEHGAGAGLPDFVTLQGGGTTSPAANAP